MATKQNVIDAYNSLLTELSENEFYDEYIEWKTKTSLRNMFKNIEDWISRPLSDWQNNIFGVENSEDSVAQKCLLSIEIIRDFVSDFEILLSGGGGGTGDITGSGTAGRIALWDANKNITSDGELLYDSTNDILTVVNISHTGNYKENVIVVNSDTTLGNTHSHIVCVNGASEITLPTITSANVKIRYDLKNISSDVVNITTDGTQKFDGDVITDLTLGVGNQITLVATEISTGEFSWITFN